MTPGGCTTATSESRTQGRLAFQTVDAAAAEILLLRAEELSPRLRGADGAAAGAELEAAYPDISAALEWFVAQRDADRALRMTNALYRYWLTRKEFEEGARWFGLALALPGGEERRRAEASVLAGFMPFWMGQDDRAAELFTAGLDVARRIGMTNVVSQALGGLSRIALRTDVGRGRALAREALDVSDAASDALGQSNALHLLGVGAQMAGDLAEARTWMTRRLALERANGNDFLAASEAANLSMVERQLGDLDAAEDLAREALRISERIGEEFTKPFAIAGLAAIAFERRNFERSALLIGAAEAMLEAKGMAWPPDEAPHHDRLIAQLPKAVGDEAFERDREAGRAMMVAEAVAAALGT
jgi:tetratricopeptide (TPR) repeat protein